jgi:hypothetical protein
MDVADVPLVDEADEVLELKESTAWDWVDEASRGSEEEEEVPVVCEPFRYPSEAIRLWVVTLLMAIISPLRACHQDMSKRYSKNTHPQKSCRHRPAACPHAPRNNRLLSG